ncbi:MAG: DUF1538 domain-containing protein [Helicobacteraceae bacterium]|jgi:hypothetical protein|nr:DUF1538 domain-containing protein [Helicobacteraceae bacterium]
MREFFILIFNACKSLLPIIGVVAFFQIVVFGGAPENIGSIAIGMVIVVIGIALLLQGLELGVFPIGANLSDELTRKGNLYLLLLFGFCLGFAAVIAEPALIAVADQAQSASLDRINALTLRIVIAIAVGIVMMLGVLRIALGHLISWYIIGGYLIIAVVSFLAPDEIISLAYDSGAVTTNVVSVPLIAAFGIGLAGAIKGRDMLADGFGLVSMALLAPTISLLFYGMVVYGGDASGAIEIVSEAAQAAAAVEPQEEEIASFALSAAVFELLAMFRDVLPIIVTILFFQFVVLRRPLARAHHVAGGFFMVICGLYAFVVGLKLGLFPIGTAMANQLILSGVSVFFVYLFAFALGFAAAMAEPALLAVGKQAETAAKGRVKASIIRLMVALGVAIGVTIGAHRILSGDSMRLFVLVGFAITAALSLITPRYIVALAYDMGGVASSVISVPMITALGIGLAENIDGRSALIDGFGMLIFASFCPAITVMCYALAVEWRTKRIVKEEDK